MYGDLPKRLSPGEMAKTLASLRANLALADHLTAILADRRQLPESIRRGLEDDRQAAEWTAFDAARTLQEQGMGLSDRALTLIDHCRTRARFWEEERLARYGDLGILKGTHGDGN